MSAAVLPSLALTIVVAMLATAVPATASETVTFQGAPIEPTAFQKRRAQARGEVLAAKPGITLTARLSKPTGAGPHPAVLLLASADGVQASHRAWAEALAGWGYVALVIESLKSRDGAAGRDGHSVDVEGDAYDAFAFLAGLDYVDRRRIGLLGFSLGATRLFPIMASPSARRPEAVRFSAGVGLYPECGAGLRFDAPILLLAGDSDPLISLGACQRLAANAADLGNDLRLEVYAGATHFFDDPKYDKTVARPGTAPLPPFYGKSSYDATAHAKALAQTRAFFDRHLK